MTAAPISLRRPGLADDLLGGDPGAVALVDGSRRITYGELAEAVADEAASLGLDRRVVLLTMRHDLESVVRLLGAFAADFPVVLLGAEEGRRHGEIAATYAAADDLHPDLALLLSTSGSTGSPKLVRLSRANVVANAASIATYLGLTPDDRAITSLPLHYCYGLSVLTSHLLSGASVVLTDLSVADVCFWDLARAERVTSFAGVPYTFDLLESSGFAERHLPDLRYVTQAGGRMDPALVRRFAALGASRGWDLFVMYGQTEATARMAYLPPELAASHPEAVGVPVPGGRFRLAPVEGLAVEEGEGELVYAGANVMMGYAECAADLVRGAELSELHTGDLARHTADGLWEVRGRLDRHAKVFGLRLDLSRLEAGLAVPASLVAVDNALHAFVTRARRLGVVRDALVAATGLPPRAVHVHQVDVVPTTDRGKTDHAALVRQAEVATAAAAEPEVDPNHAAATPAALRDLYAAVLGRPQATEHDSFVDLGGDSLSFVEVSTQLSRRLGHLPTGWQHLGPVALAATARPGRRRWTSVEPSALLRAVAISMIVVSHVDLFVLMGGAHVLLGVAGFNLARFTLTVPGRVARVRRILLNTAGLALPASLWILVVGRLNGDYSVPTALYLNQVLGADQWSADWQFWFLEALVWTNLALAAVFLVPAVDRAQRRRPFATAVVVVGAALALRFGLTGSAADGLQKYSVPFVLWCVALGWAAAEARSGRERLVVAALTVLGVAGFFPGDVQRQAVVVVGLLVLLVPWAVPLPRSLAAGVQHVATASFWIYLTHWQCYPAIEASGHRLLAVAVAVGVGLLAYRLWSRLTARTLAAARTLRAVDLRSQPVPATVVLAVATACRGVARSRTT